jgi:hypothetical protein
MSVLRKLYWGEYTLRRSFWGFYLAGYLGVSALAGVISGFFIVIGARPLGILFAAIVFGSYVFTATVGVWRSANKYPDTPWWPALAKFVVLVCTGVALWKLVNGGGKLIIDQIVASNG